MIQSVWNGIKATVSKPFRWMGVISRGYSSAETNRLNAHRRPKNQSADQELAGPFGADQLRAWARMLVRDNAWAWGVVDTIVSSVVGKGIGVQSAYESDDGDDVENINERRDAIFQEWCETCDLNGQYTFAEMQAIIQREIVEAGEVLVHLVNVPKSFNGVYRSVPLALELIEADRLAADKDTWQLSRAMNRRIVRGVELNEFGKPEAYWVYPDHPSSPHTLRQEPVRIEAQNVLHLFRRERVGQNRGVTWFAPVVGWLRDLGIYVENEMQSSAVAACFTVAIKTASSSGGGLTPSTDQETTDTRGNQYEYVEPGIIMRLGAGEDIQSANPARPNSASDTWIRLMLRGIAVGTGLSYETVARDYSQTTYSSNRASQLEDRRRFRRWQDYLIRHFCQPVWDRFCSAAALVDRPEFPTASELLDNRRKYSAVEFMPQAWEWVDPQSEQTSSQSAIDSFMATYADELGAKGLNWRHVFYQRSKEEKLLRKLGLVSPNAAATAEVISTSGGALLGGDPSQQPTGEMAGLSTLQFKRNRKAIETVLQELAEGKTTEQKARVFLSSIGMSQASIDALITDAKDGQVDSLPTAEAAV